jgi:hypothetical protein
MAWRIVRQPNGLLARWSDIVDNFTDYNLTETDAIEVCRYHMGEEGVKKKVQSGIDDIEPWTTNVKGDGLARWRDCIESIERVHGKSEREKAEKLMT